MSTFAFAAALILHEIKSATAANLSINSPLAIWQFYES